MIEKYKTLQNDSTQQEYKIVFMSYQIIVRCVTTIPDVSISTVEVNTSYHDW